mgnify:CR=1 FL=1
MRNSIILVTLFALACVAHVDMSRYDLLKFIFEFGAIALLAHLGKKDKTFLYICITILVSICYAIGKDLSGLGTVLLELDKWVRALVWGALIIILIIRFKNNAK